MNHDVTINSNMGIFIFMVIKGNIEQISTEAVCS